MPRTSARRDSRVVQIPRDFNPFRAAQIATMTNAPSSASDDRAWRTFGCSPTVKQNSNSGRFYIECPYRTSSTHTKMSIKTLRSKGWVARSTNPPYGAAPFEPRDFGTQAAALAAVPRFIEWIVDGFANLGSGGSTSTPMDAGRAVLWRCVS